MPTLNEDWRAELRALKENWNSYGAPPISEAAIATASSLAVVPTSSGGIQLELRDAGFDIEIYIAADGRIVSCDANDER